MRIPVGYLLLAISGLLVSQTSPEFHSRYGEPDCQPDPFVCFRQVTVVQTVLAQTLLFCASLANRLELVSSQKTPSWKRFDLSPICFLDVQVRIGCFDDILDCSPRFVLSYATAKAQVVFSLLGFVTSLQPPLEAPDGDTGLHKVGVRHNDEELIASITSDEVRGTEVLLNQSRNLNQNAIPDQMAECGIKVFKPVDIRQHNG
jgi:hypothetical protein